MMSIQHSRSRSGNCIARALYLIVNLDLLSEKAASHVTFMRTVSSRFTVIVKSSHTPKTTTAKLDAMGIVVIQAAMPTTALQAETHQAAVVKPDTVHIAPQVSRKLRSHAGRVSLGDFASDTGLECLFHNTLIFDCDLEVWEPKCHMSILGHCGLAMCHAGLVMPCDSAMDLTLATQFMCRIRAYMMGGDDRCAVLHTQSGAVRPANNNKPRGHQASLVCSDLRTYIRGETRMAAELFGIVVPWTRTMRGLTPFPMTEGDISAGSYARVPSPPGPRYPAYPAHASSRPITATAQNNNNTHAVMGMSAASGGACGSCPTRAQFLLTPDNLAKIEKLDRVYHDSAIQQWSVSAHQECVIDDDDDNNNNNNSNKKKTPTQPALVPSRVSPQFARPAEYGRNSFRSRSSAVSKSMDTQAFTQAVAQCRTAQGTTGFSTTHRSGKNLANSFGSNGSSSNVTAPVVKGSPTGSATSQQCCSQETNVALPPFLSACSLPQLCLDGINKCRMPVRT